MTPEQVALVTTTAQHLIPRLDAVAEDFYRRLFSAEPGLRVMFTNDPACNGRSSPTS